MRRHQFVAFAQAFPPDSGAAEYDAEPWLKFAPEELDDIERTLLTDFGCDIFDLFCPIRDPRLVATELADAKATLLTSGLMSDLACSICNGICNEVTVVRDCSHRFCSRCIQKWLRNGNQNCPECRSKIPSRRALRQDEIFDSIVGRLFPDIEKFEHLRGTKTESVEEKTKKKTTETSSADEEEEDDSSDEEEPAHSSASDDESEELLDEDDEESDSTLAGRTKKRRPRARREWGPASPQASSSGEETGGPGSFEVFLVCLNHNLPSAVCSMARELSKRPLRFPAGTTTQTVGYFLAQKLVRDVLGPCDLGAIVADLSFVREGEVWPAMSSMPISEVCRAVTESRGPIALRYLLSDRLFALCERIEHSYGATSAL